MKFGNLYVSYKRDTRLLLYWIIKTSNPIIKNLKDSGRNVALEINVTGEVTVSDLVPMSELIAKYNANAPSTIYRLFQSVIELRSIYYSQFQQLATVRPSEELERSNVTHKFFIDTLTSAFETLGGKKWLSKEREKGASNNDGDGESEAHTFSFTNKFSVLGLETDPENDDALDENSEEPDKESARLQKTRKPRKGKKRVKGKKAKRGCRSSQSDSRAPDVALESYRIIEDDDMTEYSMAVIALTRDMIQFRVRLQDAWRRVAYKNLTSAVAAATANITVALVKQSEATIFIDFPGYESYEMIKQTIIHGDLIQTIETLPDIEELFLIHTYHDLVDFITDYQKTRSGKPTKLMLAQIDNWNPTLDLQIATKEERIKWRRSYTINWLYDLVNITACVAMHEKNAKAENYVLEQMDWSDQGPLKSHHRMFGLINFAAKVTALAMQKPGTEFLHKIPPHLVFHLQCIIDAWTVSRGWTINGVKGHILREPAESFRPRRDLDVFLGCEDFLDCGVWNPENGKGYFLSIFKDCIRILDKLGSELRDALEKCQIFHNLSALLPWRFASTNPNGLAEGLELLYRGVMALWEEMPEPMLVIHLHNMLVQKGYLKEEITIYHALGLFFSDSFFSGGQPPTSDFDAAFRSQRRKIFSRKATLQEKTSRRVEGNATRARDLLNLTSLRLFKQKSALAMYGAADWDPDRIPDSDVDLISALALSRLSQTKRVRDPATAAWRLEKTDLVKRMHAERMDDSSFIALDPLWKLLTDERQAQAAQVTFCIPDGSSSSRIASLYDASESYEKEENDEDPEKYEFTAERMLIMLSNDIHGDICGIGQRCLLSFDYLSITAQMLYFFEALETECRNSSSATVRRLFAGNAKSDDQRKMPSNKRLHVALCALGGTDEELLKAVTSAFEKCEALFAYSNPMYWPLEDEDDEAEPRRGLKKYDSPLSYVM
ncbi:hypothetical protein ACQKWADRAFT_320720 [Trichoderma austrokoningii]